MSHLLNPDVVDQVVANTAGEVTVYSDTLPAGTILGRQLVVEQTGAYNSGNVAGRTLTVRLYLGGLKITEWVAQPGKVSGAMGTVQRWAIVPLSPTSIAAIFRASIGAGNSASGTFPPPPVTPGGFCTNVVTGLDLTAPVVLAVTVQMNAAAATHTFTSRGVWPGVLAPASAPAVHGSAALTGAGSLAGVGVRTARGAAVLAGVGSGAAVGKRTARVAASLAGTGTLGATGKAHVRGAAALSGAGSLSAAGTVSGGPVEHTGSATLSGAGTLAASGKTTRRGGAALSGAGTLAASGKRIAGAAAGLAGIGALSASSKRTAKSPAVLAGIGGLTASGQVSGQTPVIVGAASLSGAGTVAASAKVTRRGAAALTGAGSLLAAPHRMTWAGAVLLGAGSVTAAGRRTAHAGAALSGLGSLGGLGRRGVLASALLTGTGDLIVTIAPDVFLIQFRADVEKVVVDILEPTMGEAVSGAFNPVEEVSLPAILVHRTGGGIGGYPPVVAGDLVGIDVYAETKPEAWDLAAEVLETLTAVTGFVGSPPVWVSAVEDTLTTSWVEDHYELAVRVTTTGVMLTGGEAPPPDVGAFVQTRPDPERIVIDLLRPEVGNVAAAAFAPVEEVPMPSVLVHRAGGGADGWPPVLAADNVGIDAYAETKAEAWDLMADVLDALLHTEGVFVGDPAYAWVSAVEDAGSTIWLPDERTGRPRYSSVVRVYARGESAVPA